MTNLISRAIGISTKPKAEWAEVDAEAATTQSLLTGYVVPWAIIAAIAGVVASLVATAVAGAVLSSLGGMSGMFGATASVGLVASVIRGVLAVAVTIGLTILMGVIINALAPSFGAQKNDIGAMKVAAYAPSAIWLASIAAIVPLIGGLIAFAAAIWTIFLIHWGLVAVMKPEPEKAIGYSAVVIIIWCVAALVIGLVVTAIVGIFAIGGAAAGASAFM